MSRLVVLGSIALIVFLFATSAAVSAVALINTSNTGSSFDVIWYGASIQSVGSTENDAVIHLQNSGVNVEKRSRPLADLSDGKVVVINAQFSSVFSATEVDLLKSYVNNGGKLILTADTDYAFCNPPSTCAMEVSRNFGFGFDEDIQTGTIIPATGQSGHPIWTTPHPLASFSNWCCDAEIPFILDTTNVKPIGILASDNTPGIVLNENPAYNGGKVLGSGYNMFLGLNGDWNMFDNIMSFMLGRTVIELTNPLPGTAFIAVDPDSINLNAKTQIKLCAGKEPLHVLDAKITNPASDSFFDVFTEITIASNRCWLWNTDADFPGLSTDMVGTYVVNVDTDNTSFSSEFGVSFFVIPESPIGALALIGSSLAALGGFVYFRQYRNKGFP